MITRNLLITVMLLCGYAATAPAAILVQASNGTYTAKTTLAAAAVAADAAGKTVIVTSPLTAVQSNISSATLHAWPTDRTLRVVRGGSINPTTKFTGLPYAEPEWFGAVGNNVTDDTAAANKTIAAADEVYLAKNYVVTYLYNARPVRFTGPGRIRNTTVNKHIVGYLEGTGTGASIMGGKFGPMPAGSDDDFAAVYFEDAKHPVVAFTDLDTPNTGVRFGYTETDRATDGLLIGSHIKGSQQMGVENINSWYSKIIGNSMENGGVQSGIHGIRVSGDAKGIIAASNSIRDKLNVASFQIGGRNAVFTGNYGENLSYGFRDDAVEAMGGRHTISAATLRNIGVDGFSLLWGSGYRIDTMVDGATGKGIETATSASVADGKHRIDASIFDTGSTSLNLRNGRNLVTVLVDGTTAGTPVAVSGDNNLVTVLVSGTSLTNTVYVTGSNNVIIMSESGTGVTGLRVDGNNNHIVGRVTGLTTLNGDSNVASLVGAGLTIGSTADSNRVSGNFSGTITNSSTGLNDLSGIYGYNLLYAAAEPTSGVFPRKIRIENSANIIGQPKGWRVTTVGGAYASTRANTTAYSLADWVKWDTGATVWECTTAGTSDVSAPDIAGKVVGDTVADGTVVWTMRSLTSAVFTSEGNL